MSNATSTVSSFSADDSSIDYFAGSVRGRAQHRLHGLGLAVALSAGLWAAIGYGIWSAIHAMS